ncbi:hypothetical protein BJY00DRAFT_282335 [Aspergillus carlsbadensis]|nr:hypothetical protein BJY00DRAFT_282335 [Aspergillus carlsbadensis]
MLAPFSSKSETISSWPPLTALSNGWAGLASALSKSRLPSGCAPCDSSRRTISKCPRPAAHPKALHSVSSMDT